MFVVLFIHNYDGIRSVCFGHNSTVSFSFRWNYLIAFILLRWDKINLEFLTMFYRFLFKIFIGSISLRNYTQVKWYKNEHVSSFNWFHYELLQCKARLRSTYVYIEIWRYFTHNLLPLDYFWLAEQSFVFLRCGFWVFITFSTSIIWFVLRQRSSYIFSLVNNGVLSQSHLSIDYVYFHTGATIHLKFCKIYPNSFIL